MEVLYFGIYENNGGLENFAKNLIQSIVSKKADINFTLLVTVENFSYRSLFEKLGCKIVVLPNPHRSPFKFYKELIRILKSKAKTSVLQLNICSFRNYFLFKACKKSKIKTIIVGHYTRVEGNLTLAHFVNRRIFSGFALNITNSDDVTKFMFAKKAKTIFIDNGIPCNKFSFKEDSRNTIRQRLSIASDCFTVGQIGRISYEKNQLFSIMAFEKFVEAHPEIKTKLVFVGKEMDKKPFEYVNESNISKDVIFTGPIFNGLEMYYSAFDVCLLPSIHEGMSLSLLECASNGVQTILSTAVPKIKVDCEQMNYVDLVIDKWVEKLYECYNTVLTERKNRLIGTIYDIGKCADSYIDLYKNYSKYYNS